LPPDYPYGGYYEPRRRRRSPEELEDLLRDLESEISMVRSELEGLRGTQPESDER
jgi:hypothetical protein